MERHEFSKLLDRYISSQASESEKQQLDAFFDSYRKAEQNWEAVGLSDKEKIKAEMLNAIRKQTTQRKRVFSLKPLMRIAASVLVFLSVGYGIYEFVGLGDDQYQLVTVSTKLGEKQTIVLGDSSVVVLNAGSKLSYYKPFRRKKREVELAGEAFFEVTKNPQKPFVITSGEISTTVLGTSFNVNAYPQEDISVTVSTGKVRVEHTKRKTQFAVLLPGEQAKFSLQNQFLTKHKVVTEHYSGWQKNQLNFKQKPLSEVLKVLARSYNIKVLCLDERLLGKTLTSQYNNEKIGTIMEDLQFMLGFEYHLTDSTLVIE